MPVTIINSLDEWHQILTTNTVVVVDFYATWCGPCRMIAPKFEEMSNQEAMSQVAFVKVDVDNKSIQPVISQYEITAMPTIVVFKEGEPYHRTVGANLDQVKQAIAQAL